MRKSFLIFVMTSLLSSLCNTASAQQPNSPVDIAASAKTVADSVAQITLPVSLPEGETIESFLLKHDVYKDEEGNYISQFFGEKKKMITKDVEFWLVYWAVKDGNNESFIDCESTVFTSDDIQPEFPGGRKAYLEYIRRNMNYPADALRNGVEGGVLVKFIVEKDGSISNAEILRSMTESFDTEALRLISHMPNWTPGVWKGKTRRMQVIRLVDFRIEENDGLDIEADKADVQE